jgi:1-deoxy-D-xylulose-5-phosphate synthase
MNVLDSSIIHTLTSPEVLRQLPENQLPQVCRELRDHLIEMVSQYGGHFNANLGTVELTVALHYTFRTPADHLVWDVGHQAYGHKMLTGRMDRFHTLRTWQGLSGFPQREESPYDTFGVGHSSTAISAGMGMATAEKLSGGDSHTVAVVGDGALTGGMAYEALNNLGTSDLRMLVVVNDNRMAIDEVTGGLSRHLAQLAENNAIALPDNDAKRPANFFDHLGLPYYGPVDGHDVLQLVQALRSLRALDGPQVLHTLTVKGKGYEPAEKSQTTWHSPGKFDKITGERLQNRGVQSPQPPKYQEVFGKTLVELAAQNERIVGITPAMPTGSSLTYLMEAFPERAYDVGIAEQHAVTFSGGLATQGYLPYCALYSTFAQRAYDQIIHDVSIQKLPVVFCLDRAGCVGADGATHQGLYDIAYMRCLPNMVVSAPMNELELRNLLYTAQQTDRPFSIRYPRGRGVIEGHWEQPFELLPVGKGRALVEGERLAVLSFGHVGNEAAKAVLTLQERGYDFGHYDMRYAKPLDEALLHHVFQRYSCIITVEDGALKGGFGSAVLEFMAENKYEAHVNRLGVPDYVLHHGEQADQYREAGIDSAAIVNAAEVMALSAGSKSAGPQA